MLIVKKKPTTGKCCYTIAVFIFICFLFVCLFVCLFLVLFHRMKILTQRKTIKRYMDIKSVQKVRPIFEALKFLLVEQIDNIIEREDSCDYFGKKT